MPALRITPRQVPFRAAAEWCAAQALLAPDALELQQDLQRSRHLGYILLAFGSTFEQSGKLPPAELRSVFLRQM
jgi:hypothetical protein